MGEEQQQQNCVICGQDDKYIPLGWDGDTRMHYNPEVGWVLECALANMYAERDALRTELETSKEANDELTAQRDCFWEETQSLKKQLELARQEIERLTRQVQDVQNNNVYWREQVQSLLLLTQQVVETSE